MQTREFVSYVKKRCGGLSLTPTEIITSLNALQNEILGEDCALSRVSPDPYLTTVDGTFQYVATTSLHSSVGGVSGSALRDVRRVTSIYKYGSGDRLFSPGAFNRYSVYPGIVEQLPHANEIVIPFDCKDSLEPNSEDCVITLWEDNNPGSSTTVWRAQVYEWPEQILTLNDRISIPAQYHTTLLFHGIRKDLEVAEWNREGDSRLLYEKYLAEFKGWCAQIHKTAVPDATPPRGC